MDSEVRLIPAALFHEDKNLCSEFKNIFSGINIPGLKLGYAGLPDECTEEFTLCFLSDRLAAQNNYRILKKLLTAPKKPLIIILALDFNKQIYTKYMTLGADDCISVNTISKDTLQHLFFANMRLKNLTTPDSRQNNHSYFDCNEKRLQFLLESIHEGIWDWNLQTGYFYFSPSYAKMLGYDESEFVSSLHEFTKLLHPSDLTTTVQSLADCISRKQEFYENKFRIKARNGKWLWIESRGSLTRSDADGTPTHISGTSRNITEAKETEDKLQKYLQKLYFHIQNTPLAYVEWAADGTILEWNNAAEKIFGYTKNEITGKNINILLLPGKFRTLIEESSKQAASFEAVKVSNINKAALPLTCEWYSTVQKNQDKSSIIHLSLVHDISARESAEKALALEIKEKLESEEALKKLNQELELRIEERTKTLKDEIKERRQMEKKLNKALETAESAVNAKAAFLANMSHEIRTPLNGILGMTQLIIDTRLNSEQRQYMDTIYRSTQALLRIINDILDFSKLEAKRVELHPALFNLQKLVEEVTDIISVKAHEKNLELVVRYPPTAPRMLIGDSGRIRQILMNLLGNSVKFTEQGSIVLELLCVNKSESHANFKIFVKDTGIGIPQEKLQSIFDKFTQVDSSSTRKFEGTGLGLAISKELSEMMGGTLTVESTLGQGSTFCLCLKIQLADEQPSLNRSYDGIKNLRIMLLEKNSDSSTFISEYLDAWNINHSVADNLEYALEIMQKDAVAVRPYNIMIIDNLSDIRTPVKLAEAIRSHKLLCEIKLIILLPYGRKHDLDALKSAGFSAVISKPVRISELFNTISALSEKKSDQENHTFLTPDRTPMKKDFSTFSAKILLAEDSIINQKTAIAMFKRLGCSADIANNGEEALRIFSQNSYDAVFMDCQMPGMDGFAVTGAIRKTSKGKKIPIIAMTANALPEDRKKCLLSGMNDYISKPIDMEELKKILFRYCKCSPVKEEIAPSGRSEKSGKKVLDPKRAISAAAYDQELLNELIEIFKTDVPQQIKSLHKSAANADFDEMVRQSHKLRGSISTIGGISLSDKIQQIETSAREQKLDECLKKLESLSDEFEKLRNELENYNWQEFKS